MSIPFIHEISSFVFLNMLALKSSYHNFVIKILFVQISQLLFFVNDLITFLLYHSSPQHLPHPLHIHLHHCLTVDQLLTTVQGHALQCFNIQYASWRRFFLDNYFLFKFLLVFLNMICKTASSQSFHNQGRLYPLQDLIYFLFLHFPDFVIFFFLLYQDLVFFFFFI